MRSEEEIRRAAVMLAKCPPNCGTTKAKKCGVMLAKCPPHVRATRTKKCGVMLADKMHVWCVCYLRVSERGGFFGHAISGYPFWRMSHKSLDVYPRVRAKKPPQRAWIMFL